MKQEELKKSISFNHETLLGDLFHKNGGEALRLRVDGLEGLSDLQRIKEHTQTQVQSWLDNVLSWLESDALIPTPSESKISPLGSEEVFKEMAGKVLQVCQEADSAEEIGLVIGKVSEWMQDWMNPTEEPVAEPLLFQNESFAPIPTGSPVVSSLQAITQPFRWKEDANGSVFFRKQFSKNRLIDHHVTSTEPQTKNIVLFTEKAAWQIIWNFGLDTAKLHLIFAAHAFRQEKSWENEFSLKGSDLIKEIGWDKRTDLLKSEKLKTIAHHAWLLGSLAVKIIWHEGRGKLNCGVDHSRMWDVTRIREYGQLDLNSEVEEPEEVLITIRPGAWTERFLNKQALFQFGYIAQEILKIDSHNGELALRLAMHLTTHSRINASGCYRVGTLLEAVLPSEVIDAAYANRHKAFALKQRIYNAIGLLEKQGWQIKGFEKRPKLDRLLEARIIIKSPSPIAELLAAQLDSKQVRKDKSQSTAALTNQRIRTFRESKGWSQTKLAEVLGVSQKLISLVERGDRPITPRLETALRKLLDS